MSKSNVALKSNPAKPPKPAKPGKPYPEFPLFPHDSGRWAKCLNRRFHYFGKWDDWHGAYERYQREWPYILQGRTAPPLNSTALNVGDLVNHMLEHREGKVESGELSKRSFEDYKKTGTLIIDHFGRYTAVEELVPDHFAKLRLKLAKRLGLVSLTNEITRVKVFFNFAVKNKLIDDPVRMGVSFDRPAKTALKREKQAKAAKVFTIGELTTLYQAAGTNLKAFMLLALNGGLGNSDIGRLESKHIVDGWIVFPRPKTMVDRLFPLWTETTEAIEDARHTGESNLVFMTKYGQPWAKEDEADSPISKEFRKLLDTCMLHKGGRGFYALRHTFRTAADGCRDQGAINCVMGHSDDSMGENYTHGIDRARIQAVTDFVRAWAEPMFAQNGGTK